MPTTTTTTARRRTVFDLSPQELQALYRHNPNISSTVRLRRPRRSAGSTCDDHAFDVGIHERYRGLHVLAKRERSEGLKAQVICHKVAAQAALTHDNPDDHATRISCMAPPMPAGDAKALAAWRKPAPKARQNRVSMCSLCRA